jgi:hypothetical protein
VTDEEINKFIAEHLMGGFTADYIGDQLAADSVWVKMESLDPEIVDIFLGAMPSLGNDHINAIRGSINRIHVPAREICLAAVKALSGLAED